MRIRVLSVGPITKEKNYFHFTLNYEKNGQPERPRKFVSFDEVPYNALKGAKEGDWFDVQLTKDANGNWKWASVVAATAGSAEGQKVSAGGFTHGESSDRQKSIVRQSSLGKAVDYCNSRGIGSVEEVLEVAEQFEAWVNRE